MNTPQTDRNRLLLHEQLLLLALHDEKGTVASRGGFLNLALGGAMVVELLISGHIQLVPRGKKSPLVELVHDEPTGDALLDAALEKLRKSKRRASITTWVSRLSGIRKIRDLAALHLCETGILASRERKILGIFPSTAYPELDHRPEEELIGEIHRVVTTDCDDYDESIALLITIADAANMLSVAIPRRELKQYKSRLKYIAENSPFPETGKATADAVAAAIVTVTSAATAAAMAG